jgi:alpha-L-rhamnosidase
MTIHSSFLRSARQSRDEPPPVDQTSGDPRPECVLTPSVSFPVSSSAVAIWPRNLPPGRNQFVRFIRRFRLDVLPVSLVLHLFADTRYLLRINGNFVASGPGRFVTHCPEFDSHELAPLLQLGENRIEAEVNFFGAPSFESLPDGVPAFLAWGDSAACVDLSTPGTWQAYVDTAWVAESPLFSFAQGPVEICDTRQLGGIPVPLANSPHPASQPHQLRPFSGSPLSFHLVAPASLRLASPLSTAPLRLGFRSLNPLPRDPISERYATHTVGFALWLHSPLAQQAEIRAVPAALTLNGATLTPTRNTIVADHFSLNLVTGWNHFVGAARFQMESWTFGLELPPGTDISLHADPDLAAPPAFRVGSPGEALAPLSRKPATWSAALTQGWPTSPSGAPGLLPSPARDMAWDYTPVAPRRIALLDRPHHFHAAGATWTFRFDGEFLGHPRLVVEAPPGAVLDVACDDWLAPEGRCHFYHSRQPIDSADRFILRGGRQEIDLFHARGGKYLQITLRCPPGQVADLHLHEMHVRSRLALPPDESHFSCSCPELTWFWPTAVSTLRHSTEDNYSDCPWRERGAYIADSRVSQLLHQLYHHDLRAARRSFRLFGEARLANGLLSCVAPAWHQEPRPDFTLLWIIALHDDWIHTGDLDFLRENWPVVLGIWDSPAWPTETQGLWDASDRNFVDWGALNEERVTPANASLNLFRLGALRASAQLAQALGDSTTQTRFAADAAAVETALRGLWWPEEGRLRAAPDAVTPAVHTNVLALAFRWGTEAERIRIVAYLEPKIIANLTHGLSQGQKSGYLELYFLHYLLPALAEHGRPDLAERVINDHVGMIRQLGDDTLPEAFVRVASSLGSRCHTWSAGPAIYAARYVLGIRPADGDNPDHLTFEPIVAHITCARGRIAHRRGWIEVEWHRPPDGRLVAQVKVPPGVTLRPSAHDPAMILR